MSEVAAPIRRIAVLTADVGEGHLAAARALAEELEETAPDVDVVIVDALDALGPILRFVLLDAYRIQLRRAPWVFHALFWSFHHVRLLRNLGRFSLAALGSRRMRRKLAALSPDVVVSTYPAATSVLGSLRRRNGVKVPAVATITDFGGVPFWSHPGIDMHLVMHRSVVPLVEREAGRGSAHAVAPLVRKAFHDAAGNRIEARREFALPQGERVVVVSGGGWGVGDIPDAVAQAATLPNTTVIVLTGRNGALAKSLESTHAGNDRVRVLGFTDTVPQLLAAADVLVHTTGGVTCLEALTVGCPIIAYGPPPGHAPALARAMAKLEIALFARTGSQLRHALLAPGRPPHLEQLSTAANALLEAEPRPAARQNRHVIARVLAASAAAVLALLLASSRTAFAVIATSLALGPITTLPTQRSEVALVIEAQPASTAAIVGFLVRQQATASFAFRRPPNVAIRSLLQANHDQPIIALGPSGLDDWLGTADTIQDAGLGGVVLAPAGGISTGQYLLARISRAHLIAPSKDLHRGAIVLWKGGSLAYLLGVIRAHQLRPVPVSKLDPQATAG